MAHSRFRSATALAVTVALGPAMVATACGSFTGEDTATSPEASAPVLEASVDATADAPADATTTCDAASCLPETLATNEDRPLRVAAHGGSVYWALTNGTIRACVAANCAKTVHDVAAAYERAGYPRGIAVDGAWVYWTVPLNSIVLRAPLAPVGAVEVVADFGMGQGHYPYEIVVDTGHVYWTTQAPDEVRSCVTAVPCSAAASVALAASVSGFTRPLAMTATTLFWASGDSDDPNGIVYSVPKVGGPSDKLRYMTPGPQGIAARGAAAFVTSWLSTDGGTAGTVYRVVGVTSNILASAQSIPTSIAADATDVYWANKGDGTIRRCAISGCNDAPSIIAKSNGTPESVTLDDGYVYWCDSINGEIVRIAK
jgi:hypothetical protein